MNVQLSTCHQQQSVLADTLVNDYSTLVKRIAYHLTARLPASVQTEDLIQSGMIGLLEAAKNFDDNKGASFETYAGIRIRGHMLDEIRKGDWVPRSVHRNARMISQAIEIIEKDKGRDAKDTEIAKHLEITVDEYYNMLRDINAGKLFGYEEGGVNDENLSQGLGASLTSPAEACQRDRFKAELADKISNLPQREKMVLNLYYDEEMNLKEIGDILGITESRVCQIHSQAMTRLKVRIRDWSE